MCREWVKLAKRGWRNRKINKLIKSKKTREKYPYLWLCKVGPGHGNFSQGSLVMKLRKVGQKSVGQLAV